MVMTMMTHKSLFLLPSFFLFLSLLVIEAHARSFCSIIQNLSPRRTLQGNSDVLLAEQIKTQPPIDYRYACLDQSGVAPSRKYESNLKSLISTLSSDASTNGFSNTTAGSGEDMVYGLFACRGDVNSSLCHSCVQKSSRLIQQQCPNNSTAVLWHTFCHFRYSNQDFFGHLTLIPRIPVFDPSQNFTSAGEFDSDARILMNGLIQTVSETNLMFGTHVFNINGTQERYGWVQCSRDISSEDCRTCLSYMLKAVENCCEGKRIWRIFCPSCVVMYETHPFFVNDTALIVPTSQTTGQESNNRTMLVVIIVTSVVVVVLAVPVFCIINFRFLRKKTDKKAVQENGQNPVFSQDQTDEENATSADLPMMSLKTILQSTCNFSDEYKLGQGGFGSVYKGVLPDGKEIAVKRLSKTSGQGSKEFMNEVMLIAKLQHRNLVRLLACCIERNEKLLVYEYMPNSSLDFHLFNMEKRSKLEWKVRLSIINGIAKGLLYLHEDSRLRVIHRDLKASNILLDHEMNPKISDFGLARAFGGNQRQANTARVVGTYGYMTPEYAMEGLFSIKSDVFSFGVLLLEIISGEKNGGFYLSEHGQSLLIYAWRLWCEGKGLELIDPILERSSLEAFEVLKCIHIGLLCVQEDAADRPTMSSVVHKLVSDSMNLPRPTQPAFSVGRAFLEKESSSNITDKHDSINGLTVSEVEGR